MPAWKKITSFEFLPPNRSAPMSRPSVDLPTDGIHFAFEGARFQDALVEIENSFDFAGLQTLPQDKLWSDQQRQHTVGHCRREMTARFVAKGQTTKIKLHGLDEVGGRKVLVVFVEVSQAQVLRRRLREVEWLTERVHVGTNL